jgi:dTDP-4-dehydrorhamnose reductase
VRILVTGSNGLLGTKLLERLLADQAHEPLGADHTDRSNGYLGEAPFWRLDVADAANVEQVMDEARPDVVIHAAAFTNVDACERERDLAQSINTDGAANVARACAARDRRLVHLSTEYVFDGQAGPYRESDPVHPLGWYAQTKAAGEQAVTAAGGRSVIARTTIIYGYAAHRQPDFARWLIGQLRAGGRARIVHDQIGSPTLADNLAQMTLALATSDVSGIFNTVGADVLSRLDFARQIADVFDLDASLIDPITTADLAQPAPRPLQAGLLMDHFRATFPKVPVLGVREGLTILKTQIDAAARSGLP